MGKNRKKICLTIALIVSSLFVGGCTIGGQERQQNEILKNFLAVFGTDERDEIAGSLDADKNTIENIIDSIYGEKDAEGNRMYNPSSSKLPTAQNQFQQVASYLRYENLTGGESNGGDYRNLINGVNIDNELVLKALISTLEASTGNDSVTYKQVRSFSGKFIDHFVNKESKVNSYVVEYTDAEYIDAEALATYKALYNADKLAYDNAHIGDDEAAEYMSYAEWLRSEKGKKAKSISGNLVYYTFDTFNTYSNTAQSKKLSRAEFRLTLDSNIKKLALASSINEDSIEKLESLGSFSNDICIVEAEIYKDKYTSDEVTRELYGTYYDKYVATFNKSGYNTNEFGIGVSLRRESDGTGCIKSTGGVASFFGSYTINIGNLPIVLVENELKQFKVKMYQNNEYNTSEKGVLQEHTAPMTIDLTGLNYRGKIESREELKLFKNGDGNTADMYIDTLDQLYQEYYNSTNSREAVNKLIANAKSAKVELVDGKACITATATCEFGPFEIKYTMKLFSNGYDRGLADIFNNKINNPIDDILRDKADNKTETEYKQLVKKLLCPVPVQLIDDMQIIAGREVRTLDASTIYGAKYKDRSNLWNTIKYCNEKVDLGEISTAFANNDSTTLNKYYRPAAHDKTLNAYVTSAVMGNGQVTEIKNAELSIGNYIVGNIYWIGLSKDLKDAYSATGGDKFKIVDGIMYKVKFPVGVVSKIETTWVSSTAADKDAKVIMEPARTKYDEALMYINLETLSIESYNGRRLNNISDIGFSEDSFMFMGYQETDIFSPRADWVLTIEPTIVLRDYLEGIYTGGLVHANDEFSAVGRRIRIDMEYVGKQLSTMADINTLSDVPIGEILDPNGVTMNKNKVTVGELCSILDSSETRTYYDTIKYKYVGKKVIPDELILNKDIVKLKNEVELSSDRLICTLEADQEKGKNILIAPEIYTGLFGRYNNNIESNTNLWVGYGVIQNETAKYSNIPILPVLCVDRDINDSSLIEGWLDYEIGSGEGLEGWNMWLEGKLEYYIDLTKLYNSFKKNYRFALAEEDIIELDLITIGKIQDIYDEEDTQNEGRSFRTITIIAGVLLTIYGLMLIAAWMIDVNIGGTDYKILGRITLGRLVAIASTEEMIDEQVKYVDLKGIIIKALIAICTGVLLMTIDIIATFYWVLGLLKGVFELIEKVIFNR